tara:strand:- start:3154 stop:3531 length:378 start_codon:yes stop_codon:yes gene_type:complete
MTIFYGVIGGAILGVFGTLYVKKGKEPVVIEQPKPVVITESKVAEKLTSIDLLEVPCSSEYIKEHGDLLCREMFCLMQTRGVDAKVSGSDCSAISNVQNTLVILKTCTGEDGLDDRCIQIYRERK